MEYIRGSLSCNDIQLMHCAAFMEGKITKTGIMIHYVIREVDRGEPILVEEVPLEHPRDDQLDDLLERIHSIEHRAIVRGTQLAIENIFSKSHIEK